MMQSNPTFGDANRGVQIGALVDSSESRVKRKTITEWLAPINFVQKQNDVFSTRQKGTGNWFLNSQRFKDWQSGKSEVLWCHSIPGAGKTVLTSIAVDYLQQLHKEDPKVGVACVYCEYKQQGLQTPTDLLASIWRQLDQGKDESHPEVQAVYNRRGQFGTKPTIGEVVSVLRLEIWRHFVVYILIDALDECADDGWSRDTLITKLQELLAAEAPNSTRIQFLVTSRSPDNLFSTGAKVQIQAADEDVEVFMSQRFVQGISRSGIISENVRNDEDLKKRIISTVVEKADKIFLAARLHLDSLKYKTNMDDLREGVRHFPHGLDGLYKETCIRVTSQNPEWRILAYRTLGWLSSTFRQLKVEELCHALAIRSGDTFLNIERLPAMDVLCDSCHGLVAIDKESRIVRLVHRTAQEFFDRHRAQYFSDVQAQIARTCLDYLMLDVFAQGPCDFISSRPSDMRAAQGDISGSRVLSTRFSQNPLLDYAASHWGLHARGEPEQELEEPILRFLQPSKNLDSFFQVRYSKLSFGGIQYACDRHLNTSGSLPLHVAVSFGLTHIVNVLLGKLSASEINGLDQRGKTALHWAVQNGSESLVLLFLQAGARIDTQVKVQSPIFQKALPPGYFQIMEFCLSLIRESPLKRVVVPNEEVLQNAIIFDMKMVIELHMNSAATATEKKKRANSVLWEASSLGNTGVIDAALANGAHIEAKEGTEISTPLDVKIEDFRVLPTARREKGQTALLMAVENGRLDATLALLNRGALISATDQFGKNALQTAVTSTKVFDRRLSYIHDDTPVSWFYAFAGIADNRILSRPEQQYRTELSCVTAFNYRTQLNRVTSLELDPDSADSSNIADMFEAYQGFVDALCEDEGQGDIVNQLLDLGADIAIKTNQGQTVLHLAIGSVTRLQLLLERGAGVLEIDACDETGKTALHYAAAAGNPMALHLLLKYKADVSASDLMGATALHLGILSPDSIEFALQQRVSANATDRLGRTPMHYHFMLHKRSEHEDQNFRTPMRNLVMKLWKAGENVVQLLEKAGARDLPDTRGLKPTDYIKAPFADQVEMDCTARWIGQNEERFRLWKEVVAHYICNADFLRGEYFRDRFAENFEKVDT